MHLYEISNEFLRLQEFEYDEDSSEEIAFKELYKELESKFEDKAENIAKIIKNLKSDEEGLKKEIERLTKRKNTCVVKAAYLKKYLQDEMIRTNTKKLKSSLFSFTIQLSPPSVVLYNESLIPDEYFEIMKKADKTKIKDHLKEGVIITGAQLEQKENLVIR